MLVNLPIKMLHILVLCPVLLAASVQTLTIDSQLGTSIEDCFERISIGEQLPSNSIYRNVTELTMRECEQICKQDKQCQSYDYGVGAKGNATCNLGNSSENDIKEKNLLVRHPDYDVYVRRFQCEQSPPSPIEAQFDEPSDTPSENPSDKPAHRPVFRPADEKQTYSNDYLVSTDLGSYGVKRPVYKPQYDERPDDYTNQKPDYDSGPSYGSLKPQDVPFNPQKPVKKPIYSNRPDMHFQDPERPTDKPGYPTDDNNKPYKPYVPEKPEYVYITRPHRKPRPQSDTGYGLYHKPNNDDSGYGSSSSKPHIDDYYRPRPTTPGQYASGFGENVPYDDNYAHVEIIDPPRPYDRPKPSDQGIYGYGSYSSQNSYSQLQNSQSQNYASGSGYYSNQYTTKPDRPGYGNSGLLDEGYKPKPIFDKPAHSNQIFHDSNHAFTSQNGLSSNQASFGSSQYYEGSWHKPLYHKPSHGVNDESSSKPTYGSKPSADVEQGYGGSRPSYENDEGSYGGKPIQHDRPSYGGNKPSHDVDQPSYSSNKPSYDSRPPYNHGKPSYADQPSYGGSKPSYEDDTPSYSNNKPSYDSHRPAHGSNKPSHDDPPSYLNKPTHGSNSPSYGGNKPENDYPLYGTGSYNEGSHDGSQYYGSQSSYGSSSLSHYSSSHNLHGSNQGTNQESDHIDSQSSYGASSLYGSNQNEYYKPAYSSNRPSQDEPSYGGYRPSRPSYGGSRPQDEPSYGGSRPTHDVPSYGGSRPSHVEPSYGGSRPQDEPSYGGSRPTHDVPSYGGSRPSHVEPSYGGSRPTHDEPSYGGSRPTHDETSYGGSRPTHEPSYGGNRPTHDEPSYGGSRPTHDEPSYGGSRPTHDEPSYGGSRPTHDEPSYGGSRPTHDEPSYGGSRPTHDEPSYGGSRPTHDEPSYGGSRPTHDEPSYGGSRPTHDESSYGGSRPTHDEPSYGGSRPTHDEPSYGGSRPTHDEPSYGSNRPSHDQPAYQRPQKPKPSYGQNDDSSSGYGNSPGFDDDRPDYINPNEPSSDTDSGYGKDKPMKAGVKPVYEDERDKPHNVPSYIARPGGEIVTSRPMAIGDFVDSGYGRDHGKTVSYEACFRRVLAGKRTLRSFVRRVVPCERLEDCRRECATEKRFPCESFNYRLDRSFRGNGLCELMTKPIEALDPLNDFVEDKDFDFYELDRNSLEPNCPDTLRGPGILHSGYLSSKTNRVPERESGWRDKNDWYGGRYQDRFSADRRNNQWNRYDGRIYVPYQINQGIARSNEDESWGQYGGAYGGNERYYKDRNDYHKSVSHWRLAGDITKPSYGVKPYANNNFDYNTLGKNGGEDSWRYGYGSWKRGRWNSSGTNGLEYGESNFYKPKSHFHGVNEHGHDPIARSDDEPIKDCSSRRSPGMSLGSGAIRRSLITHNVVECETACFGERQFKCVSYSFRYSSSHGTDNCFLSERPYRGLELSADSSSDVYAMPQDQGCVTINSKPWVESECFWHVRSGAAVSDSAKRAALTVAGLGACEAECIRAHAFFCRGFSFRFDSPTIGDDLENCILTSSPPTSLDIGRGLRPNSGHELYSRGNYGRGCEPALYDDAQHRDEECYLQYDRAAKLTPSAVRGQARVNDEQSCGRACNDAPFTCLSFSFNNNAPPNTDNCLLSEIRLFDLQRGVDYVHSADDWLFAFDLFNGQCWRKVHAQHFDDSSPEIPRPLSAPPVEDPYSTLEPSGPGITGPSGPSGPSYSPGHHDPPFIPSGSPSGPGYKPEPEPPRYPPGQRPDYHETHHRPRPVHKPSYSDPTSPEYDQRPNFKPGHSGPSGPGFKPGYPEHNYKPDFSGPLGPDFKPEFSGPSYDSGFPEPSGPSFKPGHPGLNFKPDFSGPSGPDFKPGYPNPSFKPGYSEPSRPHLKPGFPGPIYSDPSGPGFRPEYIDSNINHNPGHPGPIGPGYKPGYPDSEPHFIPAHPPPSRPGSYLPDINLKPAFRPPRPQRPYKPEQDYIPGKPGYLPEKPGYLPDRHPGYQGPNRPLADVPKPGRPGWPDRESSQPIKASWRHYTVSGFPCRTGTTCAQNQVAGHWACEPEGGEIGSWDYCCAPSHRCGYSEGFHKPWCYVGPTEDQWRPCSEKYYPYHQHNVPHPSHGHQNSLGNRESDRSPQIPWSRPSGPPAGPTVHDDRPPVPSRSPGYERPQGPYLSEADRRYWDDLYKNGPHAYYDKYGNPLPGYSRVPTQERPHIKYSHNYPHPGGGQWQQLPQEPTDRPPSSLGVPRYWPVAYLHKGPPPNTTYFRYNETDRTSGHDKITTTEHPTTTPKEQHSTTEQSNFVERHRDEKQRNISQVDDVVPDTTTVKPKPTTTVLPEIKKPIENKTEVETVKPISVKIKDVIEGIDDKLDDFSKSIEIIDLDNVKGEKTSDLKTLEAEEKQIEEIGRILASRRGGKLVLDKKAQKSLENKNIAIDKELVDFNFGNRFNVERRGIVQKVTKEEIERERAGDKSLEVSETTYVRPPRVLPTQDNIRKTVLNGKVFYDATVRTQRNVFPANSTRKSKSLRNADDSRIVNLTTASNFGKKTVITRNVNPVRRVRRVYKKRYNPDEVRRRLLEREKNKQGNSNDSSKKV